jgi:hypothetical protein
MIHRRIFVRGELSTAQADWGNAAFVTALRSGVPRMLMAGAILLVGGACGGRAPGLSSSAKAEAMNRQGEYSDKRDVPTPVHFRLD